MSHKLEMAGPFNRGDTIINKYFYFLYRSKVFSDKLIDLED